MTRRQLQNCISLLIILTGLFGLLIVSGVFTRTGFQIYNLLKFLSMAAFFEVIYELLQLYARLKKGRGTFFPFYRFTSWLCITGSFWIGLLYLRPYYAALSAETQVGWMILRFVLPLECVASWLFGDKRCFRYNYLIPSVLVIAVYGGAAEYMGYLGRGYAYPFLNASQIGYPLVIENAILIAIIYLIHGSIFCSLLKGTKKKKKKKVRQLKIKA